MVAVISAVVGLALGVAITSALMVKRAQSLREDVLHSESELKVRDSQLAESNARLERQRLEHENAMTQMGQTFKVISAEALDETVRRFSQSQEVTQNLRETRLDSTLKPLEDLLDEYKQNLVDFNMLNAGALSDVKSKAAELLEAQQQTQYELSLIHISSSRERSNASYGNFASTASLMPLGRLTTQSGRSERPSSFVAVTCSS